MTRLWELHISICQIMLPVDAGQVLAMLQVPLEYSTIRSKAVMFCVQCVFCPSLTR